VPGSTQERWLEQGQVGGLVVEHALDLMQQRLTLGAVPLCGLLLEQRVNLGVTAVGIATSRDRKGFETCGRIPRCAACAQNEIGKLFSRQEVKKVARSTVRIFALIPTVLKKFATPSA
jgi:hypothetical protein